MKLLNVALIGGGAYLLYETGLLSALTGGLLPKPGTGTPASMPTQTSHTPAPPNTLSLVAANAGGASQLLNFDQWNYFYAMVRGIPGPDPGLYLSEADRNKNLSINEWWGYMQKAGMNGLGGFTAMQRATRPINWNAPPPGGAGRWFA